MTKTRKYMETMFRAGGESLAALTAAYHEQGAVYKRLRAFEDEVFGKPGQGDETEIMGFKLRNYGARPAPSWEKDGGFIGFRFDWEPLNREGGMRYAIAPIIVPLGWVEVKDHPGIYRPDPVTQPNLSATMATLNMPYYQNLTELCGEEPIITVQEHKGAAPRAYRAWPDVHVLAYKSGKLDFYIDMPRDYRGHVHCPAGAEPLLEKDWWDFRNGYGDMYEPDGRRPEGVPLPADYQLKFAAEKGSDFYLLAGKSLKAYQEWTAEQKHADRAQSSLIKAWKGGSHSYCGRELIYVEFKKHPGAGWIKGDKEDGRNTYAPDPSTREGRAILETYANLPQSPTLIDLQRRFNAASLPGQYPQLHRHDNGVVVIEYKRDKGGITPPRGAKKIDGRVFNWLRSDDSDKMCGMVPPPPPADLVPEIEKFLRLSTAKKPKGPEL